MTPNQEFKPIELNVRINSHFTFTRIASGLLFIFLGILTIIQNVLPSWLSVLQFLIGILYFYQSWIFHENGYIRFDFEKIQITKGHITKFEAIFLKDIKSINYEGDKFVLELSNGKKQRLSEKSILKIDRDKFAETMKSLQMEINAA